MVIAINIILSFIVFVIVTMTISITTITIDIIIIRVVAPASRAQACLPTKCRFLTRGLVLWSFVLVDRLFHGARALISFKLNRLLPFPLPLPPSPVSFLCLNSFLSPVKAGRKD